jgi:hypothetical protein
LRVTLYGGENIHQIKEKIEIYTQVINNLK